jgi:hypothetical protein
MQKEFYPYFYLNFIYPDHYIRINDYKNPIKHTFHSEQISCLFNYVIGVDIVLDNIEFNTDDGWLLENISQRESFKTNMKQQKYIPSPNSNNVFALLTVTMSDLKYTYDRRYIKIQGVFALTGGMIKIFMMIINLINDFCAKYEFIQSVSRDSYFTTVVQSEPRKGKEPQKTVNENTDTKFINTKNKLFSPEPMGFKFNSSKKISDKNNKLSDKLFFFVFGWRNLFKNQQHSYSFFEDIIDRRMNIIYYLSLMGKIEEYLIEKKDPIRDEIKKLIINHC